MATFSSLDFTIPYYFMFRSVSGPFLLLSEELAMDWLIALALAEEKGSELSATYCWEVFTTVEALKSMSGNNMLFTEE